MMVFLSLFLYVIHATLAISYNFFFPDRNNKNVHVSVISVSYSYSSKIIPSILNKLPFDEFLQFLFLPPIITQLNDLLII